MRGRPVMAAMVVAAAAGCAGPPAPATALADHLRRHPSATATDAYKFLHQRVFGPGHLIDDRAAAAASLERELAGLGHGGGPERICEVLGGDPALARIHLRPFLAAGGDPGELVDALLSSATRVRGGGDRMAAALATAVGELEGCGRAALAADLERLGAEQAATGFPALHHSPSYREAYRPAYRVVLLELALARGWCAGATG